MTDKQIANDGKKVFTDKEIIKALECCSHCECSNDKSETECPLYYMSFCRNYLRKQSLDLINRQQAEIERLNKIMGFCDLPNVIVRSHIDNLVKEMVGDDNAK